MSSPQNKTYSKTDVPLLFKVPESYPNFSYRLDGKDTLAVAGNTTLTELSNGEHNVTVYATDKEGNTGASETIYFTVQAPDPFPTIPVAVVSTASVVVVCIGIFLYLRRNKR